MNTQNIQNDGAASKAAVVAQDNATFAAKAQKVAAKVTAAAEKAAFPVIATAVTVSTVTCAACRIIELVRLIRGDEK